VQILEWPYQAQIMNVLEGVRRRMVWSKVEKGIQ
jgi:hypothetical protein